MSYPTAQFCWAPALLTLRPEYGIDMSHRNVDISPDYTTLQPKIMTSCLKYALHLNIISLVHDRVQKRTCVKTAIHSFIHLLYPPEIHIHRYRVSHLMKSC
jgi:hypothetical protein